MGKRDIHWNGLQKDGRNRWTVKLFDGRVETDDDIKLVTVWGSIDHNGDILVESFDSGEYSEVNEILGQYNKTVTVRAADRDKLTLLLLREVLAGNIKAPAVFQDFAESNGIEATKILTA